MAQFSESRRNNSALVWRWRQAIFAAAACIAIGYPSSAEAPSANVPQHAPFGDVEVQGSRAVFTTEKMIAEVNNGTVVRIFNRLTGTEYVVPTEEPAPTACATSLVYMKPGESEEGKRAAVVGERPITAGAAVLEPDPLTVGTFPRARLTESNGAVTYEFQHPSDVVAFTIRYALDPASGDLLVQQNGSGKREGLSAVRFGLGPVRCRGNLLLPVYQGIKANRTGEFYEFERSRWEWPTGWPIPVLMFDDALGGLWVHTQDAHKRFKAMDYRYEGEGAWRVAFDTINYAPFPPHTSVESVTWRINVYEGDWHVPIDRYKQWAYDAFDIEAKAFARPDWVDDIRLQIKCPDIIAGHDPEPYLDALCEHVEPSAVLLYLKGGGLTGGSRNAHAQALNDAARKRGFRTMYYELYLGIHPDDPRRDEFEPHFVRNPYTGDVEGWNLSKEWSDSAQFRLFYVNTAYKPFRDYKIEAFKKAMAAHPADGLFIDQSFLVFNSGGGLIDGKTTADGNLAYHRELAQALPGVAIGGEGVNEITFQYESFCELHPLSLHIPRDEHGRPLGWKVETDAFDRMVPIMPRFLMPHTKPIGYLGFPDTNSPFYGGWRDSLHVYQGIPTLTAPTIEQLREPESEVRRVIRKAFPFAEMAR